MLPVDLFCTLLTAKCSCTLNRPALLSCQLPLSMDMVGSCSSLTIELKCHWTAALRNIRHLCRHLIELHCAMGVLAGDSQAFTSHNSKKEGKIIAKISHRDAYSMSSVHLVEENNMTIQRRIPIYSHISYTESKYCPVVGATILYQKSLKK